MASRPKVSVIVPSYNHARYLPERLDSILGQTFQDFELVFLDDASPDDSRTVFARYAQDPRIRAVFNGTNSGSVFKQWNRGISLAAGELVWIAESDDVADPRFLEVMVGLLDRHPDAVLAYSDSMVIDPEGTPSRPISDWINQLEAGRWSADFVNDGVDEIRRYLVQRNTVPNASAVVFRKNIAERTGGARTDLRLASDWAFWVGLLAHGKVAYTAERLNRFRKHPASVTSRSVSESRDIEENYILVGEMAARFHPCRTALEASLRQLSEDWFWRCHSPGKKPSPERNRAIHRAATACDRRLPVRWWKLWIRLRWTQVCRHLLGPAAKP